MSPAPLPEDPLRLPVQPPRQSLKWQPWARGLFWLAAAVLAVMSLLPGERLPAFTASIWDKTQHVGGFAALTVMGMWAYGATGPLRVLTGLMAFGVAIEFGQAVTGWRHGDAWDAIADAVGIAAGWCACRMAQQLRANRRIGVVGPE